MYQILVVFFQRAIDLSASIEITFHHPIICLCNIIILVKYCNKSMSPSNEAIFSLAVDDLARPIKHVSVEFISLACFSS